MSFVYLVNGAVLAFLGALSVLVGWVFPDSAKDLLSAGLLSAVVGGSIVVASMAQARADAKSMRAIHGFIMTSTVWLTAASAGALPLYFFGLSWTDAFFEAMSGITTTGSTVMTGLDSTPKGILFWRCLLQGVGGIGFVVLGIALLPMMRIGGMQLFRTESSDKDAKELNSATKFALASLYIYVALTAVCTALFLAGGMSIFDATTLAMATLSTGGFANSDSSFAIFTNPFLHWVCTVFMVLGAMPFVYFLRIWTKGTFRSEQVSAFLIGLAFVIAALVVWVVSSRQLEFWDALRLVSFNVVSVVTTTGFASVDYTQWGPFVVTVFVVITAIGGCTGSTAGGAKIMRWVIISRAIRAQISRVHSPHAVIIPQYEGKPIAPDVMDGVIAFMTMYLVTFAVLAMALGFVGLDFQTAVSGAITALANVGPGVGPIIGPVGNFQPLPDSATNMLSLGMYVGRLELMTVFVLFTPAYWREALH